MQKRDLVFVISFLLIHLISFSQEKPQEGIDEKFLKAREILFLGQRAQARQAFKNILKESPTYIDARLLLGRAYSWDKIYDSAYFELSRVIEQKPTYEDAWIAIISNESWAERYLIALNLCDRAIEQFPVNDKFKVKKAELLIKNDDEREAIALLKGWRKEASDSSVIKDVYRKMVGENGRNKAVFKQYYEYHEIPYVRNWMITSFGYSRKTKIGTVIGRVNVADFVKQSEGIWKEPGYQLEMEAYPKVHRKMYLYLAYAYNPNGLFPRHRVGTEAFASLPSSFEASAGFRYMLFKSSADESFKDVMVYTVSAGKYYKNFWFSVRTYLTPKTTSLSKSLYFSSRRYFKNGDNYLEFITGFGASPDEYSVASSPDIEILTLNRYSLKLGYSDRVMYRWLFTLRGGYEYQEFRELEFRHLLSLTLQLGYRF